MAEHPHLEFSRLPGDSPQLDVIERFGKPLRRRVMPIRRFDTMADLKGSIRASVGYDQTVRARIRTLIAGCYVQSSDPSATTET